MTEYKQWLMDVINDPYLHDDDRRLLLHRLTDDTDTEMTRSEVLDACMPRFAAEGIGTDAIGRWLDRAADVRWPAMVVILERVYDVLENIVHDIAAYAWIRDRCDKLDTVSIATLTALEGTAKAAVAEFADLLVCT